MAWQLPFLKRARTGPSSALSLEMFTSPQQRSKLKKPDKSYVSSAPAPEEQDLRGIFSEMLWVPCKSGMGGF